MNGYILMLFLFGVNSQGVESMTTKQYTGYATLEECEKAGREVKDIIGTSPIRYRYSCLINP